MNLINIRTKINNLFQNPLNKKFDQNITIESNGIPVKYGIVNGNQTIVVLRTGLKGSYIGWQNKYLKIARLLNSEFGCTVISISNPPGVDNTLNLEKEIIKYYVDNSDINDFEVYYMGFSNSANVLFNYGNNYEKIKKMLIINLALIPEPEEIQSFISNFKGESIDFIYGEKDYLVEIGKEYFYLENDKIHFTFLNGVDHDFTDNTYLFIALPYFLFFYKDKINL